MHTHQCSLHDVHGYHSYQGVSEPTVDEVTSSPQEVPAVSLQHRPHPLVLGTACEEIAS